MRTLFAYLTDPDQARWLRHAEAAVAGLALSPSRVHQETLTRNATLVSSGTAACSRRGRHLGLSRVTDESGCAVTVILDPGARDEENPLGGWTALAVLDDRLATIPADPKAHRRRWAAWLYWGNIVQFLSDGAGDGNEIAYTNLERFDPHLLAAALKVASSSGFRASLR